MIFEILQEKKKYHPEDKISVQLWVDKMKSLEQSPVLYFKQQGEVDAQQKLGNEDFILIIMLPIQQELLKMLGQQMICVDSTHGTTAYDFYLSTILTVDEFGSGLPCAYCLSNRIDTTSYSLFFAAVREKLGKLETTVFMSDDASAIYNAWKDIMGPATHQLLCTWHVDRAWRKKVLSSFPDKVTQALMYKMLRVLLEEPNPEKFENLIKEFIQSLNQKETKEFQKYFVHTYASRPKVWAYCYRKDLGINTNMYLEAMHRVLKHLLFGRQAKIHKSHKESEAIAFCDITKVIDSIQWQVKSQSITNSIYVVEKKNENIEDHTQCKLLCNKCNVCVHVYSCTCPDYEVSLNMCKHIHAVIKIEKETSNRNATNELSCDILADDPNTLFKSVENYRVCISKETKTIDQSSEYCELEKNLNAVHAIVKKRKLNKIQMCELNTFLNDWLRKISVESSFNINSSTTCNNIPANKNITKQTRYKSTKQKSKKRDSAYSMKKPSEAQKENIQKMMQNKGESVLEIHTDNDHVY
ncbi:uncharacterized protein [Centruroides vittatus]|uniref:uncharacterized protein n=1 Tax=Centruroides vittatus TaxID=120091 RepID=UPI00350F2C5A